MLELYLDYMDKRITKCKAAWLEFYRSYNGSFGRIAAKIKERDARTGSMNPDDYQDPLCTDLLALLVYSKMSNELLEFIQDDLKDTDKLGTLNDKIHDQLQSIIEEIGDKVLPAMKQTMAILTGLRANLKAIISIHGEGTPFALGFQLNHLNSCIDNIGRHMCLCETVVAKLGQARRDIQHLLVFLNTHVLKIHY